MLQVTATFLLPEMVGRTATTLNYFLSLLTGPKRKGLAIKEPEKYNFKPRWALSWLASKHLRVVELSWMPKIEVRPISKSASNHLVECEAMPLGWTCGRQERVISLRFLVPGAT